MNTFTNPNESGSYTIEHATNWSQGGRGEKPMRLVVIGYVDRIEYALRWQDVEGNTFGGYSYQDAESAHRAFLYRYLDHNERYGMDNISHLPGFNRNPGRENLQ